MSYRRSSSFPCRSLTPLERTRLLIGIVMIPLAATCVFASGVYSQRHADFRPERALVEVRAVLVERDRKLEDDFSWQEAELDSDPEAGAARNPATPWYRPSDVLDKKQEQISLYIRPTANPVARPSLRLPLKRGPPSHAYTY